MTADEFRDHLRTMDPQAKDELKKSAGAGNFDDDRCVEAFVSEPAWEKRFCRALGELTEVEKVGAANVESARYARKGYHIGVAAMIVAMFSLAVSLFALLK